MQRHHQKILQIPAQFILSLFSFYFWIIFDLEIWPDHALYVNESITFVDRTTAETEVVWEAKLAQKAYIWRLIISYLEISLAVLVSVNNSILCVDVSLDDLQFFRNYIAKSHEILDQLASNWYSLAMLVVMNQLFLLIHFLSYFHLSHRSSLLEQTIEKP